MSKSVHVLGKPNPVQPSVPTDLQQEYRRAILAASSAPAQPMRSPRGSKRESLSPRHTRARPLQHTPSETGELSVNMAKRLLKPIVRRQSSFATMQQTFDDVLPQPPALQSERRASIIPDLAQLDLASSKHFSTQQSAFTAAPFSQLNVSPAKVESVASDSKHAQPNRRDVKRVGVWLDETLHDIGHSLTDLADIKALYLVYSCAFGELARQVAVECADRAELLRRIWSEFFGLFGQLLNLYDEQLAGTRSSLQTQIGELKLQLQESNRKHFETMKQLRADHINETSQLKADKEKVSNDLAILSEAMVVTDVQKSSLEKVQLEVENSRLRAELLRTEDQYLRLVQKMTPEQDGSQMMAIAKGVLRSRKVLTGALRKIRQFGSSALSMDSLGVAVQQLSTELSPTDSPTVSPAGDDGSRHFALPDAPDSLSSSTNSLGTPRRAQPPLVSSSPGSPPRSPQHSPRPPLSPSSHNELQIPPRSRGDSTGSEDENAVAANDAMIAASAAQGTECMCLTEQKLPQYDLIFAEPPGPIPLSKVMSRDAVLSLVNALLDVCIVELGGKANDRCLMLHLFRVFTRCFPVRSQAKKYLLQTLHAVKHHMRGNTVGYFGRLLGLGGESFIDPGYISPACSFYLLIRGCMDAYFGSTLMCPGQTMPRVHIGAFLREYFSVADAEDLAKRVEVKSRRASAAVTAQGRTGDLEAAGLLSVIMRWWDDKSQKTYATLTNRIQKHGPTVTYDQFVEHVAAVEPMCPSDLVSAVFSEWMFQGHKQASALIALSAQWGIGVPRANWLRAKTIMKPQMDQSDVTYTLFASLFALAEPDLDERTPGLPELTAEFRQVLRSRDKKQNERILPMFHSILRSAQPQVTVRKPSMPFERRGSVFSTISQY
eukprot:TRINITY_DN7322_c0_g1_i1.p1 TRINITY_DN7322_c0_g1~~TRINITY_DN7322_c0_g1_i1.p1  ORF type:complete len:887 (-),score=181.43 TRINITY_DN7322_c0_g1_i1:53-2713(-)